MPCYYRQNASIVRTDRFFLCADTSESGVSSCCDHDTICLSGGICTFNPNTGVVGDIGSGYYNAACTDPTLNDERCNKYCLDQARPDVVYNSTTKSWHCCSVASGLNYLVDCSRPTFESFSGDSPENLLAHVVPSLASIPISTSSDAPRSSPTSRSNIETVPNITSIATSTSPLATPTSTRETVEPVVSSSRSIGLPVGIALGGLALVAVFAFVIVWRRRNRDRPTAVPELMDTERKAPELDTDGVKHELDAGYCQQSVAWHSTAKNIWIPPTVAYPYGDAVCDNG